MVAVANERIRNRWIGTRIACLISLERTNAVRPGIVSRKSDALRSALPHFQQQTVISRITAALDLNEVAHKLSRILRIDERQPAPRIGILCRRTDGARRCPERVT